MPDIATPTFAGDRLAKVMARAGLCSRRDAEDWIRDGRVAVNGKTIRTPAFNVTERDVIKVDGNVLAARQGTRVWLYHKPPGLVVTEKDPEGRETIFETLEAHGLPRVVSIGRLDINTEGLLLLTNDGGLKRVLELPATGWLRRYRVRAFGEITQAQLDQLKDGTEIDGIAYGPIEATLEREQGSNVWMIVSLREGKNREVKNVLAAIGLKVNRLIRVSFGPFQLGDIPVGAVEVVKARVLREQLGKRLADEAGVDFDSDLPEPAALVRARVANPKMRAAPPGRDAPEQRKSVAANNERFHFTDRADSGSRGKPREEDRPPRKDRPGRPDPRGAFKSKRAEAADEAPPRKIHFADGRDAPFEAKLYGKKPPKSGSRAPLPFTGEGDRAKRGGEGGPKRDFSDRPKREFSDKPKRPFGDKPKGDFADRPKRPYAPRPATDGAERPKRVYGDKPRSFAGKPKRDFADKPRSPRSFGDKPKPAFGDKPKRSFGAKPAGAKSFGDKPRAPRPTGAEARIARGPKPAGNRPRGSGPGGDRPRRPRPPKI